MRKIVAGLLVAAASLLAAQAAAAQAPGFTQVTGSPFATGTDPASLAFSPNGALVATADTGGNNVAVFGVSSVGALGPVPFSLFPTGVAPSSVAFSPNSGLVAVANRGSNAVQMYSVASNGSLTPAGFPVGTGVGPQSVAFSPNGSRLAVANRGNSTVSMFSVSRKGLSAWWPLPPARGALPSRWRSAQVAACLLSATAAPTTSRCSRSVRTGR